MGGFFFGVFLEFGEEKKEDWGHIFIIEFGPINIII